MLSEIFDFVADIPKIALYISLLAVLSTHYLMTKCRRDPRLMKFSKTLPGPDGLPLVGNAVQFVFSGLDGIGRIFDYYAKTYGPVYKLWLGNELVIGLSDVEHLEKVFRSTKTKEKPPILFCGFHEFWGNSLFSTTMSVWRHTRKRIQPVFGKNILKFRMASFDGCVQTYVELLKSKVNGPEFNVKDYTPYLVIDAFLDSYFHMKLTMEEKHYFNFHKILDFSAYYGLSKIIFPWLRIDLISRLYYGNQVAIQKRKLKQFFDRIKETRISLQTSCNDNDVKDETVRDVVSITQKLEEEMQIENYMFDELMDMIAASADTTSSTISFCTLMIAIHSEIQKNLYEEMRDILGDIHKAVGIADLQKLQYLDQVVKETQRLFPVIPNVLRYVEEDLDIGSMTIPGGSTVLIRIQDVHMNPDLYPNPTEFNPENFTSETISRRSKYSFLPFSMGVRECVGKTFAETMVKLTIVHLLRNFQLHTTTKLKDVDCTGGFVVQKRGGYSISITPRK